MLGGCFHHNATNIPISSVHDMVPLLFKQRSAARNTPCCYGDCVRVQILGHQLGNSTFNLNTSNWSNITEAQRRQVVSTYIDRHFRRLDDYTITGCNHVGSRTQGQFHWKIPRRNVQYYLQVQHKLKPGKEVRSIFPLLTPLGSGRRYALPGNKSTWTSAGRFALHSSTLLSSLSTVVMTAFRSPKTAIACR